MTFSSLPAKKPIPVFYNSLISLAFSRSNAIDFGLAYDGRQAVTGLHRPDSRPNESMEFLLASAPTERRSIWTLDDEADLQALLKRRESARLNEPGNQANVHSLTIGQRQPRPNTIAGTIFALVGLKGTVMLEELLSDMSETAFPHHDARPESPEWCHLHVATALRKRFLRAVDQCDAPSPLDGHGGAPCA